MTPKEALNKLVYGQPCEPYITVLSDESLGEIIKQALTELEELKRYPTSEEVCRQLQLFWGNNYKVNVSITNQIFIESKKDKNGNIYIEWDGEKIYFDWMPCYPPHLITLIGRFYEGVEKK